MEEFLRSFDARLSALSDEAFATQVTALVKMKECEDAHLGEEVDRNWFEVLTRQFLFQRLNMEVSGRPVGRRCARSLAGDEKGAAGSVSVLACVVADLGAEGVDAGPSARLVCRAPPRRQEAERARKTPSLPKRSARSRPPLSKILLAVNPKMSLGRCDPISTPASYKPMSEIELRLKRKKKKKDESYTLTTCFIALEAKVSALSNTLLPIRCSRLARQSKRRGGGGVPVPADLRRNFFVRP